MQVLHVPQEGGLGHIGRPVGRHDGGQILFVLLFAQKVRSGRGSRRIREPRCGGGPLDPGIHIGFIIVTNVDHIVAPFQRPGQGLEPDIVGAPVAAENDEFEIVLDLALFL